MSPEINEYRRALVDVLINECNVEYDEIDEVVATSLMFNRIEELKLVIDILLQVKPQGNENVHKITNMVLESAMEYYAEGETREVSLAEWAREFRADDLRCNTAYKENRKMYVERMLERIKSIPMYKRYSIAALFKSCGIEYRGSTMLRWAFDDLNKAGNKEGIALCKDRAGFLGDGLRFIITKYYPIDDRYLDEVYFEYGNLRGNDEGIAAVGFRLRMTMREYNIHVRKGGEFKDGAYIFEEHELAPVIEFIDKANVESYLLEYSDDDYENEDECWMLSFRTTKDEEIQYLGSGLAKTYEDLPEYIRNITDYLLKCSDVINKVMKN